MKKLFFILFFLFQQHLSAQESERIFNQFVSFSAGYSKHGTGDINGVMINMEYNKHFKKKLFWSAGFNTSIYDGQIPQFYTDARDGQEYDLSIRYTTAGFQFQGKIGYDFIRTPRHELGVSLGALLRYQSSSYYDDLTILYLDEVPFPVNVFVNRYPQRTYTIGGMLHFFYQYAISKKVLVGTNAGFQTDSFGDTILNLSLSGGLRF